MNIRKFILILLVIVLCLPGTAFLTGCGGSRKNSGNQDGEISEKVESKGSGKTYLKDSKKSTRHDSSDRAAKDSSGRTAEESKGRTTKKSAGTSEVGSAGKTTAASADESTKGSGKKQRITFDNSWEYASYSKIHSGKAALYLTDSSNPKGITVCVNAGHGTKNGSSVETQCHPDGSPKLVAGSTAEGSITSTAISEGMTFPDGTSEADATLSLALLLKDRLLSEGYNVLMIRETQDVQLDNIARTVMANHYADCHIALHYDDTTSDKGAFYMTVPNVSSYRNMEPVKSHWREHHKLGNAVIAGLKKEDIPIFNDGTMAIDLTQTSYSTIPSIDLEVGDGGSDISEDKQSQIVDGIVKGIHDYFRK